MTINEVRKIKSLMVLAGVCNRDICRKLGVSETWVSLVVNGKAPSVRIRQAIADACGQPYEKLWGKRNKKAA